ncbi:MAG: class I SAM-dependent methyltransferase [Hyphomicrobium sp.]
MLERMEAGAHILRGCESCGCEICGSPASTVLPTYSRQLWPVVECDDCGFVFLGKVPSYDALIEEFAWEKTFKAEKARRRISRFGWLDAVTRWRTKAGHLIDHYRRRRALGLTGNVLDIGCGGACRIPAGPIPFGIEISAGLAQQAAGAFSARGGNVIHAPAIDGLDVFEDRFFSAILMRSYLEHESQPRLVLEKAFRKLAPGGSVFVRVPDYGSINRRFMGARWCGFRFPDHVNYFTGRSLRSLAESVGFEYSRTNWHSIFDDNIIALLKRPQV